jgi:hypothetical protein
VNSLDYGRLGKFQRRAVAPTADIVNRKLVRSQTEPQLNLPLLMTAVLRKTQQSAIGVEA